SRKEPHRSCRESQQSTIDLAKSGHVLWYLLPVPVRPFERCQSWQLAPWQTLSRPPCRNVGRSFAVTSASFPRSNCLSNGTTVLPPNSPTPSPLTSAIPAAWLS